ncbi:hypothetical protein HWV62_41190 [Athelia sp. TMB]|nr:hypothetical protein HWV62_41190 [Athelia sp. TMB]
MLRPTEDPHSDAFQFVFAGPDVDHATLCTDTTALLSCLVEHTGLPRDAFGEIIWVADYRMVDKFGEGRVFVVGDAAHVHSPAGGQGMNSSVQDALSLVAKSLAPASLLSSYTAERLPVIAEMLNISMQLQKLVYSPRVEKWMERGGKLLQLGVNYRGSTIVVDETEPEPETPAADGAGTINADSYTVDGALRGGDRAPDAPELVRLGGTTRLFDIFKSYLHTVLIFSSAATTTQSTAVLEALQKYPTGSIQSVVIHTWESVVIHTWEVYHSSEAGLELATMVVKDKLGHAYQGYAVAPRSKDLTVFIVRPDGVIGGLVHGVGGVQKYFNNIFL